jgi:hypothetical protein
MPLRPRQLTLALLLAPAVAAALPPAGAPAPTVAVEDTTGQHRALPDAHLPIVVLYEDQAAEKQNVKARELLGGFTDKPQNRAKFEFLAVADLEKWNWWPARKYALADLQKIAKRENTTLWCDWKGAVRRGWGLTRSKSAILVIDTDGKVRFSGEGTLSEAQLKDLAARLIELGATH